MNPLLRGKSKESKNMKRRVDNSFLDVKNKDETVNTNLLHFRIVVMIVNEDDKVAIFKNNCNPNEEVVYTEIPLTFDEDNIEVGIWEYLCNEFHIVVQKLLYLGHLYHGSEKELIVGLVSKISTDNMENSEKRKIKWNSFSKALKNPHYNSISKFILKNYRENAY